MAFPSIYCVRRRRNDLLRTSPRHMPPGYAPTQAITSFPSLNKKMCISILNLCASPTLSRKHAAPPLPGWAQERRRTRRQSKAHRNCRPCTRLFISRQAPCRCQRLEQPRASRPNPTKNRPLWWTHQTERLTVSNGTRGFNDISSVTQEDLAGP